ncbi:MAG: glycosyltransferase family 4 protein [Verrucomicrobiae bacterium]|nr:glycosyltransferase family 4 protein [Verrucomicrobiae bacterium]
MILHYYQQFFPSANAVGYLTARKLMGRLADRGHDVTVFACDFNPYDERDEPEEEVPGRNGGRYRVRRLRAPRGMRRSLTRRFASYGAFAARAWSAGRRAPRPQLVIGSIQPLFTGSIALRNARSAGVPFVLEVVDLWPDALEAKGAVTGIKARVLHRMANQLYRHATRIVSLTPGIRTELVKKGISPRVIDVLPNGFDPDLYAIPVTARAEIRRELGWDDQFVAVYAGAHTEVTAVETYVRAANVLKHRRDIRFDLFGSGQTKAPAMRLAAELQTGNLHFHDPVPKPRVPHLLAGADVALMALFRSPLIHIYFESKFMDYMGAGKPILGAMGGQQADVIRRFRTGKVVDAFDHEGLAALVAEAADNYGAFAEMGANGARLVRERLLLPDIIERYVDRIEAVAAGRAGELEAWEPFPA